VWQRGLVGTPAYEKLVAYWKQRLRGPLPVIELPFGRSRKGSQPYGATLFSSLTPELSAKVNAHARRHDATPFTVLLTTFKLLLRRYLRSQDIVVGTPVANRTHREIEGLLGCFINTLVLRTDLGAARTFREAVACVRQTALDALSHQAMPFELLVNELQPERSLYVNPLFQVMFSMQNAPLHTDGIGASIEIVDLDVANSKFDLTLTAMDRDGAIALNWTYRADLYDAADIERMAAHYRTLLESALDDADRGLDMLPLLSFEETSAIVAHETGLAETDIAPGRTYVEWFDACAAACPDAIAVRCADRTLTYDALRRLANGLAGRLIDSGIGPGDTVAIRMERSETAIVGLLATMKAGAAYLPIDPAWPSQRVDSVLDRAGAMLVLTDAALAPTLASNRRQLLVDTNARDAPRAAAPPAIATTPNDIAYVIFTSGTSGEPKGTAVEHRHLVRYVENMAAKMTLPAGSRYLVVSTLAADLAHTMLFPCLISGGTLLLATHAQSREPEQLARWLEQHPADALKIVPSHLDALTGIPRFERLLPTRLLVTGGESLSTALVSKLKACRPELRILNHYGPTETTVGVVVGEVDIDATGTDGTPPLGRPLGDARTYICDRASNRMPFGIAGELCIGGPTVARGYVGRDDLTAERFFPDPFSLEPGARLYRSGDLARFNPDGTIQFLGRIDDQVKIRGHRVEPLEVEHALKAAPGVRNAAVRAVTIKDRVVLAAWIAADSAVQASALRAHLATYLTDAMIPERWSIVPSLPLTANGKVDRHALSIDGCDDQVNRVYIAPRTLTELRTARLWARLLGRERVGATDNFFELGGHSLLAVRLIAAIQREFGIVVPLNDLFANATLEAFARLLDRSDAMGGGDALASSAGPLVAIQPDGERSPLFFVHPAGGNVLCYRALSDALGPEQPFYGLRAIPHPDDGHDACSIESMAQAYIAAIRERQPVGPYRIGGWSMGGVIAFEMAQRLRQAGEDVSLLAILDIPAPGGIACNDRDGIGDSTALAIYARKIELFSGISLEITDSDIARLSADALGERVLQGMRTSRLVPDDVSAEQLQRFMRQQKAHNYASIAYVPTTYHGELTVIRCVEPPAVSEEAELLHLDALYAQDALGWERFTMQPPRVLRVPGNHVTMMSEPHVEALARELRGCLA
jgi:amino acid adenylation domain-containing protein